MHTITSHRTTGTANLAKRNKLNKHKLKLLIIAQKIVPTGTKNSFRLIHFYFNNTKNRYLLLSFIIVSSRGLQVAVQMFMQTEGSLDEMIADAKQIGTP